MMLKSNNRIRNIVIVKLSEKGGGDIHLNMLSKIWREYGINIHSISINSILNFKNNLKFSFMNMDKIISLTNADVKDLSNIDLIISVPHIQRTL